MFNKFHSSEFKYEVINAYQNEKWVTDVTEFKYESTKKSYLSAIRDLYDD